MQSSSSRRGYLQIPQHAQILRAEPAIKYKVKQSSLLYGSPPVYSKNAIAKIITSNQRIPDQNGNYTSARIVLNNGLVDNIFVERINANAKVLARPYEYPDPKDTSKTIRHPELMEVVVYKKNGDQKRVDMPEAGHGIEVIQKGFMYKTDLIAHEKFVRYDQDIFNEAPTSNHVQQSWMGNCFLLATLNGILAIDSHYPQMDAHKANPERISSDYSRPGSAFIQNMMVQLDDGTVMVRFFDPNTGKPLYVQVENSYHVKNHGEGVKHSAPWIHILEKAYAVLGYKLIVTDKIANGKEEEDENESEAYGVFDGSFLTMYGSGGKAHLAMKMITGQSDARFHAIDHKFAREQRTQNPFDYALVLNGITKLIDDAVFGENQTLKNKLEDLAKDINNYSRIENLITNLVEKLDQPKNSWIQPIEFLLQQTKVYKSLGPELLRQWGIYIFILMMLYQQEYPTTHLKAFTQQTLSEFIDKLESLTPPPPAAIIKKFRSCVMEHQDYNGQKIFEFPGGLLEANYSKEELKLFADIKTRITNKEVVTAHTLKEYKENGVALNTLGLCTTHVYTVVGTQEFDVSCENGKTKKLLLIKLRNPWGHTGRSYDFLNKQPVKTEHAEFYLDIYDFAQHFRGYSAVTLPNPSVLEAEIQKEEYKHKEKINAFFAKKFEDQQLLGDQYQLLNALLAAKLNLRQDYLQMQSEVGLYQLIRFVENLRANTERELLKDKPGTHPAKLVYEKLDLLLQYRKLLACARGIMANKFAVNARIAQHTGERVPDLVAFFKAQDKINIRHAILLQSFGALGQGQGDINHGERDKADFIFELMKLPPTNLQDFIQSQPINDLYQLLLSLKEDIAARKSYAQQLKMPELQQIAKAHLHATTQLLKMVKKEFVKKMKTDVRRATYQLNAREYETKKNKNSWFKQFRHLVKTFFSSTNDRYLSTYKHHLKQEAKFTITDKIAQLAFDYLSGEGQLKKTAVSQSRVAEIVKTFNQSLTATSKAKLTKHGHVITITLSSENEIPIIFELEPKLIHELAIQQQRYEKLMLEEIKLAQYDMKQLAKGFGVTPAKGLTPHQIKMRGFSIFALARQQKLEKIAQSKMSLTERAAQAFNEDEKIKSKIAAKANVPAETIVKCVLTKVGDDYLLILKLTDHSTRELTVNQRTIEALAIHSFDTIASPEQPLKVNRKLRSNRQA